MLHKELTKTEIPDLTETDTDRIIEMAWEDRTSFDVIKLQFGLDEKAVITLMRNTLKASSFKRWRERVHGRAEKHLKLVGNRDLRFKCSLQKQITYNKISKR